MIFILSVLPMVRIISYLYYMLDEQRKALVRTLLIFPCVCMFLFFSHFLFFFLSGFLFDNFCNYYHCMNDVMIVITTITIAIITIMITIIIIIIIIIIKIMIITIILMIKIMITMVIVVSINQTYFMLFLCYLL